jgi:hypothetical protein
MDFTLTTRMPTLKIIPAEKLPCISLKNELLFKLMNIQEVPKNIHTFLHANKSQRCGDRVLVYCSDLFSDTKLQVRIACLIRTCALCQVAGTAAQGNDLIAVTVQQRKWILKCYWKRRLWST